MKISFIVTYYNQEQYVKQSLESILAVDKPSEWEIIVGDDGSSDGTLDIVKKYMKMYPERIRLNIMPREQTVKYDPVKRASANRLSALDMATGDAFCILDGDDFFFDKSFVKDAIQIFNENKMVTVVAFGYKYYTNGSFGKEMYLPSMARGLVDKKNYIKSFYLHAGGCVHRLCWGGDRLNYLKEIGYFDDNDIVFNSLNYGEMYAFNRSIYAYRQTGESVYTSMDEIEKAVLNTLGFDVDLKLIDKLYTDELIIRNSDSLATVYICRKQLSCALGQEKYNKYLAACKRFGESYCLYIMNYKNLDIIEQNKLDLLMYRVKKVLGIRYTKKLIKYAIWRLLNAK